ncbi:MAG: CPBP family intramembrane metalloprotease [Myxococcales bacterium FL481]|nr:MAG: CPBP family intramembrane metalloprotease [Myxococcales bacterium FL481]
MTPRLPDSKQPEPDPTAPEAATLVVRHARQAILLTVALYGGYGLLRAALPGQDWLAVLLVGGFYLVPGWALRDRVSWHEYAQVGPEIRLPPWSWRGGRLALVTVSVVFPLFAVATFAFYWRACQADLSVLAPVLWIEQFTPGDGSLEAFLGRLCRHHGGGFWPADWPLPAAWTAYGGLGFVSRVLEALFVAALPEEMFHRGYLMSALERRFPPRRRLLGVPFGVAAVLSSLLFAAGHLVGEARTDRLATFFPGLLFAWLWRRGGSIWAPTLVHATSNLFMQWLLAVTFARG